ncbi:hypothetical protein J6590_088308, partial [Homalodisca vitripennis]
QLLERRGVGRGRGRVSGSLTGFETVAAYADVHTMDGRTRRHGSVTWPLALSQAPNVPTTKASTVTVKPPERRNRTSGVFAPSRDLCRGCGPTA